MTESQGSGSMQPIARQIKADSAGASSSQSNKRAQTVVRRTRAELAESNEFFVKKVQENQELLFGPLSPTVTAAKKNEKWEEIRLQLVDKGDRLLSGKNASYMQSTYWKSISTKAKEKRDLIKSKTKTGEEPNYETLTAVS